MKYLLTLVTLVLGMSVTFGQESLELDKVYYKDSITQEQLFINVLNYAQSKSSNVSQGVNQVTLRVELNPNGWHSHWEARYKIVVSCKGNRIRVQTYLVNFIDGARVQRSPKYFKKWCKGDYSVVNSKHNDFVAKMVSEVFANQLQNDDW